MDDQARTRLTPQQIVCLDLVGQGYTSKQIARLIGLKPSTVDNHVLAACRTLGLTDRDEAARLIKTSAVGQQLPRQPGAVASPNPLDQFGDTIGGQVVRWCVTRIPPIGGRINDLEKVQRAAVMARIILVSVIVFIITVILMRQAFRILS